MFLFWLSFTCGIAVVWLSKKIIQFFISTKYPEDSIEAMTPLWNNWDFVCTVISGAFVLIFYVGELLS